jgi:hypothetical protein
MSNLPGAEPKPTPEQANESRLKATRRWQLTARL